MERPAPEADGWERLHGADAGQIRDRFRGCMLGGAVGDALGAPLEFLTAGEIAALDDAAVLDHSGSDEKPGRIVLVDGLT